MGWIAKIIGFIKNLFKSKEVNDALKIILMKIVETILEQIFDESKQKKKGDNRGEKFV